MRTLTLAAIVAAVPFAAVSAQQMTAPTYVMKAGASDLYETQSSQLLLTSTSNEGLKRYANQMIEDHARSTADVKAAAAAAGMTVAPPRLEPMQARNMAALRAASGAARDRLYVQQQRVSHRQALALHQGYARSGTVSQLKQAATTIVPVVEHHLGEITRM